MSKPFFNCQVIDEHKENLEAQLICWDQIRSGEEEVSAWVNSMVSKLGDSLNQFDDTVTVEARLAKFKVSFLNIFLTC